MPRLAIPALAQASEPVMVVDESYPPRMGSLLGTADLQATC
jgi:hypothetical protein